MKNKDPEYDEGIKVTDRRRFTSEGGSREDPPTRTEEKKTKEPIDFLTFLLSLASSVQVHLGLVPNPATGKTEQDLVLAQQTIDILGMLQEKTRGNLNQDEEHLFEMLLYELRLKFVEMKKK